MTKKHINIILILAVISLWGTVLYKYVNRFFGDEVIVYNQPEFSLPIAKIEKDTFQLLPLERDPFLGKIIVQKENQPIRNKTLNKFSVKKVEEPILNKPYPIVQYFGYIKSQDKSQKLILLKVNNRLERVRLNDNIDGLEIKEINKDSVVVSFNKIQKSIHKIK